MTYKSTALFDKLCADLQHHLKLEEIPTSKSDITRYYSGASFETVAARSLVSSLFKKLKDEVMPTADSAAFSLFAKVNESCERWEDRTSSSHDEILMGELRSSLHRFWTVSCTSTVCSSFEEIWHNARVGPGAGIQATGTDFYSKLFSSPLTSSSIGLVRAYHSYISNFPEWTKAEFIRQLHFGMPTIVKASKLMTVPKKYDISRTICVEPTLNMFAQLGFGHLLEERLKTVFGIDLAKQPDFNRDLARIGSIDGSFATIDLSSASDSISMKMLSSVLPREFFSWLNLLRTPYTKLPSGAQERLNMVSTMGNGFTFPLQTIIFACVVDASLRARGLPRFRCDDVINRNLGVFGDDIIIPCGFHYHQECPSSKFFGKQAFFYGLDIQRDVYRLLDLLGFSVNKSKSFFEGPFRESCGADFYAGADVRGVYLKTLRTQESRYVAYNRLQKWSLRTGIPLPRALTFLRRSFRYLPVPMWENDDAGVQVPSHLLGRLKISRDLQSVLYRRRVRFPRQIKIGEESIDGSGKMIYNASGLFLSFLTGCVRDCKISVRLSEGASYRTVWGVAPHWE